MTTLPIVGARFRPPAEKVLKLLPSGTKLLLRRQPDNPYDENAVQVLWDWSQDDLGTGIMDRTIAGQDLDPTDPANLPNCPLHLGFIPREAAKEVAPRMDQSWEGLEVEVPAEWNALLTFGLTGLPSVSFEEPKE